MRNPPGRFAVAGFSLVELITIIGMLGILAAVVLPRFADSRSYADILLKDQLLASAGFARQAALNRHNQTVALVLGRGDNWDFSVRIDTNGDDNLDLVVRRLEVTRGRATLALVAPQNLVVNGPDALVINYDNLGNLTAINDTPLAANLAFVADERILCLTLAGHAYDAATADDCTLN